MLLARDLGLYGIKSLTLAMVFLEMQRGVSRPLWKRSFPRFLGVQLPQASAARAKALGAFVVQERDHV